MFAKLSRNSFCASVGEIGMNPNMSAVKPCGVPKKRFASLLAKPASSVASKKAETESAFFIVDLSLEGVIAGSEYRR